MANGNGPLLKIRAGSITAAVWSNTRKFNGKEVEIKSISLARSYQDKKGKWVETNSYQVRDLPKVILVAQEAYKALTLSQESTAKKSE